MPPAARPTRTCLFQGGFAAVAPNAATTYNFANDDRAPLLFIAVGNDHSPAPRMTNPFVNQNRDAASCSASRPERIPAETSWGNPVVAKAQLDAIRAQGFRSIRIPVTWSGHVFVPDYGRNTITLTSEFFKGVKDGTPVTLTVRFWSGAALTYHLTKWGTSVTGTAS